MLNTAQKTTYVTELWTCNVSKTHLLHVYWEIEIIAIGFSSELSSARYVNCKLQHYNSCCTLLILNPVTNLGINIKQHISNTCTRRHKTMCNYIAVILKMLARTPHKFDMLSSTQKTNQILRKKNSFLMDAERDPPVLPIPRLPNSTYNISICSTISNLKFTSSIFYVSPIEMHIHSLFI